MSPIAQFLKAAISLARQGVKQDDILRAAQQQFGEVSDLLKLQINKIFKTKNQPVVGKKDPVFDNTVETIPFDDTGTPFNSRNPQKVYGKPREGIKTLDEAEMDIKSIDDATNELNDAVTEADAFSESIGFPAATKKIKNEPLDPDDVLPNYNETPGEFARRNTSGSKENLLEQMKAAYPQRYNNLTGNETAAELKGIMEKANKTDIPFTTGAGATKKIKNRDMTPDEFEDFEMDIGSDNLEAYSFDGTVDDGARILKEEADYKADMFMEYKKGKLDPVAGDKSPARKRFLEKKLEDAEMSGDRRLITQDEVEELSSFDLGTEMDNAKLSVNDEIKKGVDEIMSDTSPAALQKSIEVDNLMLEYPGMSRELAKQIANDPDPARKAQVISMVEQTIKMGNKGKSGDEIIELFKSGKTGDETLDNSIILNNFDPKGRKPSAKGGRIKMAKGGLPNILGF